MSFELEFIFFEVLNDCRREREGDDVAFSLTALADRSMQ